MAYMKRNVNFGFFLLLTASLICLVGVSVYYQTTFKDLYLSYKDKIDELSNISSTLISERNRLNQTSYQLMVKEEREEELSSQYGELKEEKDKVEAEKSSLQSQLSSKTAELIQKRAELYESQSKLAAAQAELVLTKESLNTANTRISSLSEEIDNLEDQIDLLNT